MTASVPMEIYYSKPGVFSMLHHAVPTQAHLRWQFSACLVLWLSRGTEL